MLRKLTLTGTPLILAAAVVQSNDSKSTSRDGDEHSPYKCKPSELPIYTPLHASNTPAHAKTYEESRHTAVHAFLEEYVRLVRQQVQSGADAVNSQLNVLDDYVDTAKAHTLRTIDYLNEPQNALPRSGAIAIGGLAGFIMGARGGLIKKALYTSIGAGAIACMCYPRQAEDVSREVLGEVRKYSLVAYNFVKGVKPGDDISKEPISKFPTTLQDVKYLFLDLWDEAVETVIPSKSK